MIQQSTQTTSTSLHPDTELGLVALTVRDLSRSVAFYRDVLGFELLQEGGEQAVLGAGGTPLLVLHEKQDAGPAPTNRTGLTGLYHFAILVPSRADLARSLLHMVESGYPLGGASDHLVSEALYLSDPDNNGIEIYRDRPREEWPRRGGQLQMASDPLDLRALLAEAQADPRPWNGLAAGTRLGHMHLQVADIPQARDFYHGVLGFDIVFDWERMGALFVSAGGYHHHLGLNTWHSRGGRPAPEGSAGLRYFTVYLPDEAALAPVLARLDKAGIPYRRENGGVAVEDPWRNGILFLTGTTLPDEVPSHTK
ncbi:MAG: VOC family protein [Chloroflexota bacterium]|nr:VOC family protein [Chloroflexota bacterium]